MCRTKVFVQKLTAVSSSEVTLATSRPLARNVLPGLLATVERLPADELNLNPGDPQTLPHTTATLVLAAP